MSFMSTRERLGASASGERGAEEVSRQWRGADTCQPGRHNATMPAHVHKIKRVETLQT